jgi:putative hydrolase of the HAD superfamily
MFRRRQTAQQSATHADHARYDAVFFDMYGTLVDIRNDETADRPWQALWRFFADHGVYFDAVDDLRAEFGRYLAQEKTSVAARLARERIEVADEGEVEPDYLCVYSALIAAHGRDDGGATDNDRTSATAELAAQAGRLFRDAATPQLRLYSGAEALLGRLHDVGIRTLLVSNAQACFTRGEIQRLGLHMMLDDMLLSSDYGVKKPNTWFFEEALHLAGTLASRTLMVGNEERADILGAARAGIDAAYLCTEQSVGDAPRIAQHATRSFAGADYGALGAYIFNEERGR